MELFKDAKVVRLQSYVGKYLYAKEDGKSVIHCEASKSSPNILWEVEKVSGIPRIGCFEKGAIRLKSCYGKYLARTKQLCSLGGTGVMVVQAQGTNQDPEFLDWGPVRGDSPPLSGGKPKPYVLLMPRYGKYCLRASGGHKVSFDLVLLDNDDNDNFGDKAPMHKLWKVDVVVSTDNTTAISSYYNKNKSMMRPNNAPRNTNVPNPLQPNGGDPNMPPTYGLAPFMPTYPVHQVSNIFLHSHFTGRDYVYTNSGNNKNGSGTQSNGDVDQRK